MKTAVEWLEEKFLKTDGNLYAEDFTKAKEMEKQQIVLSYKDGRSDQQSPKHSIWFNRKSEEYYNDMFKSEE